MLLGNYTNNALSSLTNNGSDALIDVASGYTLDNQSALANGFVNNGGLVGVEQGGTVATGNGQGVYLQNAGDTVVNGNWTQALTDIEGGQLLGSGTVGGLVYNNANPGSAPANTGSNAGVFGNVAGNSNLTFTGLVTGTGNYGGTVTFDGALSPGDVASAAANPNAGGAVAGFPTTPFYPNGTGSIAAIHGGTMIFGASDDLFMDINGTVGGVTTDTITADNAVLGGTLTLVPTGTLAAGSYDLITASGHGNGISGDFAIAQMLNLGNDSDLYLTTSKTADAYTATLRSTLTDYGVAVDGTVSQIGGAGQTDQAPGQDVTLFLETSFSSATLATGGNGHDDGPGGNGGAGNATNIVTGSGASLAVATGGNGGFGTGAAPNGFGGHGGVANAVSQMNGATGSANALATGGNGGAALGNDVGGTGGTGQCDGAGAERHRPGRGECQRDRRHRRQLRFRRRRQWRRRQCARQRGKHRRSGERDRACNRRRVGSRPELHAGRRRRGECDRECNGSVGSRDRDGDDAGQCTALCGDGAVDRYGRVGQHDQRQRGDECRRRVPAAG